MEQTYFRETWLHGVDGENVLLAEERSRTPFSLHIIGTTIEIEGREPATTYTVRQNFVGDFDATGKFPIRQTLVLSRCPASCRNADVNTHRLHEGS